MTAFQVILLNIIIIGGAALLAYALTHGDKNKSNKHKTQH